MAAGIANTVPPAAAVIGARVVVHPSAAGNRLGASATLNPGTDDVWKGIRARHGEALLMGAPMAASDAYLEASGAAPVGETIALLSRHDLAPMITHRFPLARFAEALAVARDANAGAKVMVEP